MRSYALALWVCMVSLNHAEVAASFNLPKLPHRTATGRAAAKLSTLKQTLAGHAPSPPTLVADATNSAQHAHHSPVAEIRTLFFLFYGCLGAVMPYLPVYYKSLGLQGRAIGALGAITPAITFIVSPLWGALADETGRYRDIMLYTFVGSALARLATVARSDYRWITAAVLLTAVLNAPVKPLMDSAVMNVLTDKSEYGRQRLFGQLGFGFASSMVGPLLTNPKYSSIGYKSAFLAHALFAIPTAIMMARFVPKKKKEVEVPNFAQGFRHLATNPDVLVFFAVVFLVGLSSGVIENFAYVRLEEIGGEGTVMGVSRLVSSLAGGPMFWMAGAITKRIGVMGVLQWSLVSYVIRFIVYAKITNPWHAVPAEFLRGAVFAVFWTAATCYAHEIAPPGLQATMLSLLNGVYGGLGQSLGSLIGGSLQNHIGTPRTFLAYAAVDASLLLVLVLYRNWRPLAGYVSLGGTNSTTVVPPR